MEQCQMNHYKRTIKILLREDLKDWKLEFERAWSFVYTRWTFKQKQGSGLVNFVSINNSSIFTEAEIYS